MKAWFGTIEMETSFSHLSLIKSPAKMFELKEVRIREIRNMEVLCCKIFKGLNSNFLLSLKCIKRSSNNTSSNYGDFRRFSRDLKI